MCLGVSEDEVKLLRGKRISNSYCTNVTPIRTSPNSYRTSVINAPQLNFWSIP